MNSPVDLMFCGQDCAPPEGLAPDSLTGLVGPEAPLRTTEVSSNLWKGTLMSRSTTVVFARGHD